MTFLTSRICEKKNAAPNGPAAALRIAVLLSNRGEQFRLVRALQKLCPDAEVCGFDRKEELLQAAENRAFPIVFLCAVYGAESGIAVGKRLQKLTRGACNLIYVMDSANPLTLTALWEMHISGILPLKFTAAEVKAELDNLRYPVLDRSKYT